MMLSALVLVPSISVRRQFAQVRGA
jgi:hypothetical protein